MANREKKAMLETLSAAVIVAMPKSRAAGRCADALWQRMYVAETSTLPQYMLQSLAQLKDARNESN